VVCVQDGSSHFYIPDIAVSRALVSEGRALRLRVSHLRDEMAAMHARSRSLIFEARKLLRRS
jgi:hypothetical protein